LALDKLNSTTLTIIYSLRRKATLRCFQRTGFHWSTCGVYYWLWLSPQ